MTTATAVLRELRTLDCRIVVTGPGEVSARRRWRVPKPLWHRLKALEEEVYEAIVAEVAPCDACGGRLLWWDCRTDRWRCAGCDGVPDEPPMFWSVAGRTERETGRTG